MLFKTSVDFKDIYLEMKWKDYGIALYLNSKWKDDTLALYLEEANKDLKKWIVQHDHQWKWVQIYPKWTKLTQDVIVQEMLKDMTYSITHNAKSDNDELLYSFGINLAKRIWYQESEYLY